VDFSEIGDSIWFTFITMSSVGYGNMMPSTPVGRFLSMSAAIFGAFILGLLVTIIGVAFALKDNEIEAVKSVTEQKRAARCIVTALQYNALRSMRYKMLDGRYEEGNDTRVTAAWK
jgi:voltage-gated potassium channel